MNIFDKFGLKKSADKDKADKTKSEKFENSEKTGDKKDDGKNSEAAKSVSAKKLPSKVKEKTVRSKKSAFAYKILVRPILSEKATVLASSGKYVFAVSRTATKPEIRKSIENVYDVQVENVHVVKMQGKQRRYGRSVGKTSAWKKAIISVKKGEKIPGIIESVG